MLPALAYHFGLSWRRDIRWMPAAELEHFIDALDKIQKG